MRLTLLGTGDAGGMPRYGCDCTRCTYVRSNPLYQRRATSALLEFDNRRYLIDAGLMDITERFHGKKLDGILLTHFHPDHVQGLFHLRWGKGNNIPVYCPPDTTGCADLFKNPGILEFRTLKKFSTFRLGRLNITPVPLIHSKPTLGYLIEDAQHCIAYLVDTKTLPPKVEKLLAEKNISTLIIDTSSPPDTENRNHNNLNETLAIHETLASEKTVLTHIGHDMDVWLERNSGSLPSNVVAGCDNDIISTE